jgi:drug/metabolite transporter (DMT)-like permease
VNKSRMASDANPAAYTGGFVVAAIAPLFCTIGITLCDMHWTSKGGHPFMLNLFKCSTMSILFALVTTIASPSHPAGRWTGDAVGWLILSSILGIAIGDTLWLAALKHLGAREMILVDSTKPFMVALFGWLMLGEGLTWAWMVGCTITMGAVTWVSLERAGLGGCSRPASSAVTSSSSLKHVDVEAREVSRAAGGGGASSGSDAEPSPTPETADAHRTQGFVFAFLNVVFDAVGAVITKQHAGNLLTWEINLVRFGFAAALMCALVGARAVTTGLGALSVPAATATSTSATSGRPWHRLPVLGSARAWRIVLLGCLSTTFVCPLLTAWALFRIDVAVYGTLTSTGPIYSLPVVRLLKKEHVSRRAVCGAFVAVGGVIILRLAGSTSPS